MAKVLNPFMSGDARGSVGALTASRNRSGAIMRQKVSPVQPRTNQQQLVRYDLQSLTSSFQGLTIAQIVPWTDFSNANTITDVFGNAIKITALNWFVRLNARLLQAGLAIITAPPATANPSFNPVIDASFNTVSSTGIDFSFSIVPATGERIWIQWSGNVPITRNFLSKDTRQRKRLDDSDTSPDLIIPIADLIATTTQRHITAFAVDEFGRGTPKQRFTAQAP